MTNLMEYDIAVGPTFAPLPFYDQIFFKGLISNHVQLFEALKEGEVDSVFAVNIIRQDEKFVWESCLDLLNVSIESGSQLVRGVYHFNLLNFDVHKELQTFNTQELTHLLVSRSRRLAPGQQKLIKYSSLYGLLQKLVEEEWGKIIFKAAVEVFPHPAEKLDLYIKKIYKLMEAVDTRKIAVINDLSQTPLYDQTNTVQQDRLAKEIRQGDLFHSVPDIIIHDKNGHRVLNHA